MSTQVTATPVSDVQQKSLDLVKSFYANKEKHDLEATMALFADDIVYTLPLNANGEPTPWFQYDGKQKTYDYQRAVLERFKQIRMLDPQYVVSTDGSVVFVETRGDYVATEGNKHYNNVYVFKFMIRDGKFIRVYEYANPVTYAIVANLPIGPHHEFTGVR